MKQKVPKKQALDKEIISGVYDFEKKRTISGVIRYIFFILLFSIITISCLVITYSILKEQQTLDLLDLFFEDKEIIAQYLGDVLNIFYIEMPKEWVLILLISVLLLCVSLFIILKKSSVIKNRLQTLRKEEKENK